MIACRSSPATPVGRTARMRRAFAEIGRSIGRLFGRFRRAQVERRELLSMSTRELRDIGLNRSEAREYAGRAWWHDRPPPTLR